MDTSETYKWYQDPIYHKMCEKAEEIQGQRQWGIWDNELNKETREGNYIEGDVVCADSQIIILGDTPYKPYEYTRYGLSIGMVGYDEGDEISRIQKLVWLPRIDQLQEISGLSWLEFDRQCEYYPMCESPTKEQAGIQVAMKEKYQKRWNGEEWVKVE